MQNLIGWDRDHLNQRLHPRIHLYHPSIIMADTEEKKTVQKEEQVCCFRMDPNIFQKNPISPLHQGWHGANVMSSL